MSNHNADAVRVASRIGIVFGIVAIILGFLAILMPFVSGVAVTAFVAVILIAAGIMQMIFAFKAGSFGEGFFTFLFGLFAILCGIFILARPLIGLASVALLLAAYFFVDGFYGIVMSFRIRPRKGWGWMLISSLASVALGFLIIWEWPVSGAWAVGLLVGIRLIFVGWSMIALGGMGDAATDEMGRGTA